MYEFRARPALIQCHLCEENRSNSSSQGRAELATNQPHDVQGRIAKQGARF